MNSFINIRFQKKDIGAAIANSVFIGLGLVMCYLAITIGAGFVIPGLLFAIMGIYPFSKSEGVLVDMQEKTIYHYTAKLWIKSKSKITITNFESILVTTGTQIHKGGFGTIVNTKPTVSFMVYKLYLIPTPYQKIEKVMLGDFLLKRNV